MKTGNGTAGPRRPYGGDQAQKFPSARSYGVAGPAARASPSQARLLEKEFFETGIILL